MEPKIVGDAGDKFMVCSFCEFKVDVPDEFEVTKVEETVAPDGTKKRVEIRRRRSDLKPGDGSIGQGVTGVPGSFVAIDESDLPEQIKDMLKDVKQGKVVSTDLPGPVLQPEDLKRLIAEGSLTKIELTNDEDRRWLEEATKDLPEATGGSADTPLRSTHTFSKVIETSHVGAAAGNPLSDFSFTPSASSTSEPTADLSQVISLVKASDFQSIHSRGLQATPAIERTKLSAAKGRRREAQILKKWLVALAVLGLIIILVAR